MFGRDSVAVSMDKRRYSLCKTPNVWPSAGTLSFRSRRRKKDMQHNQSAQRKQATEPTASRSRAAVVVLLCFALTVQGCFDPVYPQRDREERVMEALNMQSSRALPPSPLTPTAAVVYALANNLDARVAEIETAYYSEAAVAAKRRLLPSLNLRYSMDHNNHPSARWSESTRSGNQSLESSYSSDPNSRQGEVGLMWNLIDFGVGYLRSRQQGERILHSSEQQRRVKQQVVLDVLTHYWRTSAAVTIAEEAEALRKELEEQAEAIRDSVEMRILSGAEGARRELAVHGGLAELEQWRRAATQARLELARVMGCGNATGFKLAEFPKGAPQLPQLPDNDPTSLQTAALQRRPELFQQDTQERVAVDEARIALLQMAPNANLSLSAFDDPDKFLEWGNWMTVGARVSWNLFNIPARLTERRMARLQGETARHKGLAMAAAIMAQVGIAYSEWRVSHDYAAALMKRSDARQRLVDALAAGEKDGQTRPGEVLQEKVRLLSEKAASMRASAEARVAGARLANAIGLDVDDRGRLIWQLASGNSIDFLHVPPAKTAEKKDEGKDDKKTGDKASDKADSGSGKEKSQLDKANAEAVAYIPDTMSGLKVVKAEDFLSPDSYFEDADPERGATLARAKAPAEPPAGHPLRPTSAPAPKRAAAEKSDAFAAPDDSYFELGDLASEHRGIPKQRQSRPDQVAAAAPAARKESSAHGSTASSTPRTPIRAESLKVADFESVRQSGRMAEAVEAKSAPVPAPASAPEPAIARVQRDPWDEIMTDLTKTSFSEQIGDTHISENVRLSERRVMAVASEPAPAQTMVTLPPPIETPERIDVPMPQLTRAAPLVEYPEELQAQTPPGLEGFSDMRKVPLTSFIGPKRHENKEPSAAPAPRAHEPDAREQMMMPMAPMPMRPAIAPPSTMTAHEGDAVPTGSLRPPSGLDMERQKALAPLPSLVKEEPVVIEQRSSSSLRPPGKRESVAPPPVLGLSPNDFDDEEGLMLF